MTTALAAAPVNEAPPANLVEKLAAVMAQVERVPKTGWNDFHKYHYATEADITECVRDALAARGVMLIPSVTKNDLRTVKNKSGGEEFIATLTVQFTITDGKERIEFNAIGEGQDRGDKATYKAMTGALKYALLKLFLIPTGDDPEREEGEKPHAGVRGRSQQAPRPAPRAAPAPVAEAAKVLEATVVTPEPVKEARHVPTHTELWEKARIEFGPEAAEHWRAAAIKAIGKRVPNPETWTEKQRLDVAFNLFGRSEEPAEQPGDVSF